jgi:transposase
LGVIKNTGLDKLLGPDSPMRRLCLALIVQQVISPGSKLSSTRRFFQSSLGLTLGLEAVGERDILKALDWLYSKKKVLEEGLAKKHLADGDLVFYDLSSSYLEGRKCSLAQFGYSRDKKRGKVQITYGLLLSKEGYPVSIEVFPGATQDSVTMPQTIAKISKEFGVKDIVVVGDRGMIAKAGIKELKHEGFGWITALRSSQIRSLIEEEVVQLSLFDEVLFKEVKSESYPGERLIFCRNPLLREERRRKREELILATSHELKKIRERVEKGRLKGDEIALKAGSVINRYKMAKHFRLKITEKSLDFTLDEKSVTQEAALDGIYVIRTSVKEERLEDKEVVRAYKQLSQVERAFRSLKAPELEIRPVFHHLEDRVKAHIFLCMLAYYVQFELKSQLKELLFHDENPSCPPDPVSPKERSASAKKKASSKQTTSGHPVNSFPDLLAELSTMTLNEMRIGNGASFTKYSIMTPIQAKAFDLLGVNPQKM